jgi:hypothetical protein
VGVKLRPTATGGLMILTAGLVAVGATF